MFSGAQIFLYSLTDDIVGIIGFGQPKGPVTIELPVPADSLSPR